MKCNALWYQLYWFRKDYVQLVGKHLNGAVTLELWMLEHCLPFSKYLRSQTAHVAKDLAFPIPVLPLRLTSTASNIIRTLKSTLDIWSRLSTTSLVRYSAILLFKKTRLRCVSNTTISEATYYKCYKTF